MPIRQIQHFSAFGNCRVNSRSSFILLLILTLTGLTSGCRGGCSLFGRSLSLLVVPMYKQPLGYSSSYHEHLTLSPELIGYTDDDVVTDQQCKTTVPAEVESPPTIESRDTIESSDKVIFPKPCGPVCELPTDEPASSTTDAMKRR
jgi:hypothetical protein